jgi:hypothetical protein
MNHSDNEFERVQIPNNFVVSPKGKQTNEIYIVPPKICPICGNKEGLGKYKLRSQESYKFIKLYFCEEHKILANYDKTPKLILYIFVYALSFIIVTLIIAQLVNDIVIIVGGLTSVALLFLFITIIYLKGWRDEKLLREHFVFQFSKNDSFLLIKRRDWAMEFKMLNTYNVEGKVIYDEIQNLERKWFKNAKNCMLLSAIFISIMVISIYMETTSQSLFLAFLFSILNLVSLIIVLSGTLYFGIKGLYYLQKQEELKYSKNNGFAKKTCILYLIVIIAIIIIGNLLGFLLQYYFK